MAEFTTPPTTAHCKRDRGSPTQQTPQRPRKRVSLREGVRSGELESAILGPRSPLFPPASAGTWSSEEVKALVEFVLFHTDLNKWPTHKREGFWSGAASFVKKRSHATLRRTGKEKSSYSYTLCIVLGHCALCIVHSYLYIGSACRNKVVRWLSVHFKTPADADAHYFRQSEAVEDTLASVVQLTLSDTRSTTTTSATTQTESQNMTEVIAEWLKNLEEHKKLEEISKLFQSYVLVNYSVTVPSDFLELSARAMAQLKLHNRSNVLYKLAKSMGTLRRDRSDSCFPMKRMPMGMIEYIADFFVSDEMQQVSACIGNCSLIYI